MLLWAIRRNTIYLRHNTKPFLGIEEISHLFVIQAKVRNTTCFFLAQMSFIYVKGANTAT